MRYKFPQNTNYRSSTVRFTNKVEREWEIGLRVGMIRSSLENSVLYQRKFYEIKLRTWNKITKVQEENNELKRKVKGLRESMKCQNETFEKLKKSMKDRREKLDAD